MPRNTIPAAQSLALPEAPIATLLRGSVAVTGEGLVGTDWKPVHNRKLRRAVQTSCRTSPSYPETQVSGHELAGI